MHRPSDTARRAERGDGHARGNARGAEAIKAYNAAVTEFSACSGRNKGDTTKSNEAIRRALAESQRKLLEINQELGRLTNVDGLTGLSNRRYFNEFGAGQWKLAVREQTPIAVLMTDVDYFKRYNDHYGHLAGEEVVKNVGAVMRQRFVRPTDLAAHFGGEEFVVLLPATPFEALEIAHAGSGVCKHVTTSVGGAVTVPQRDDELLVLIEVADQALCEAKHAGRNRIVTRSK